MSKHSKAQILRKIKEVLVTLFELPPEELKNDSSLAKDLELDSLDGVDLVLKLENTFHIRITESEFKQIDTIADIYRLVAKHLMK